MPDIDAEAVESTDKLVKQLGDRSAQVADNALPLPLSLERAEVVLLSASLTKTSQQSSSC